MTTAMTYRLFVAVTLSRPVQEAAAAWSSELAQQLPFRKWVHPDDLHITLQFLGPTQADRLDEVKEAVCHAARQIPVGSFPLQLGELGTFGRPQHPSILWAGITGDGLPSLHEAYRSVCDKTASLGFERENRPFHPHLTLAREYHGTMPLEQETLRSFAPPTGAGGEPLQWTVSAITLYRSHLGKRPMYEPLAHCPLSPGAEGIQ